MTFPTPARPVIALLTDFGNVDAYVGMMKGVIAMRCPSAQVIDITHEIQPQNVRQGAYLLGSSSRYFPPRTVFVAVVDPGVGTSRRPIGIETDQGLYIGPDNGIFTTILEDSETLSAVILRPPSDPISMTFHGRDLFAPVAADLACGRPLAECGTPISPQDLIRLPPPQLDLIHKTSLEGEVLHIDHFGNLITSLGPFEWHESTLRLSDGKIGDIQFDAERAHVIFIGRTPRGGQIILPIRATYGETEPDHLLALVGSGRQLEIAVNQGNAAALLRATIGDKVRIIFTPLEDA